MPLKDSIDALESRVTQLLNILEALSSKHEKLEQSHQDLQIECARLQKKNAVASDQIEVIIKQLKAQPETPTGGHQHD